MKYLTILFLSQIILVTAYNVTDASWFIETRRFYFSAHGEFSCDECHGDIADLAHHPDPALVNRDLTDFFSDDDCADCHHRTCEEISGGRHGRLTATPIETFAHCLSCHDAHYPHRLTPEAEKKIPAAIRQAYGGIDDELEKYKNDPLELSDEDKVCLKCHARPPVETPEGRDAVAGFCIYCHGYEESKHPGGLKGMDPLTVVPRQLGIDPLKATSHSAMGCLACHPDAAGYRHGSRQTITCRSCHTPHPAITANDAHLNVDCEACHLKGKRPVREPVSGRVAATPTANIIEGNIHDVVMKKTGEACERCHHKNNTIGAPAGVLPPKSVICMPCHAATFSAGDAVSIVSLVLFGIGVFLVCSVWVSGSSPGKRREAVPGTTVSPFGIDIFRIFKILIMDVLLNRRLYARSPVRWLIHSMIFLPFLFRFIWGLTALILSHVAADWPLTWQLLNRNHPATAFLFDLTGLMVVLGVGLAIIRKATEKTHIQGLPGRDLPALLLMGGVIIIGFVLEGIRMAMAPLPAGAELAFAGYLISRSMVDLAFLDTAYVYTWYAHAVLTGMFLVYLPFSRMLHIVMAPIILVINGLDDHRTHQIHAKENL